MKRKHGVLFGFAVFLTAAILVFAGCPADGGGDGGSSDPSDPQTAVYTSTDAGGNTYTMTVTETVPPAASYNRAYTAKAEDVYELLIAYANGSPSKKSKGKVLSVQDGGVVVLQPTVNVNVTFNVTINVTTGAMTNITAPNGIACEDNTTAAVPSEGLTLNPAAPLYFNALAANGSQTEATTQLSLTLASTAAGTSGVETVGLEASHITVTPNTALTKGALSFSGGKWLLAVSGVGSTQTVTVSIAGLDGYALVPVSRTATVFDGKSSVISDPEITGSITQDSILGEAGQQKTYVYNGMGQFEITNNATLTVLPGTTIRFTKSGAGIAVQDGSTIKLNGTAVLLDAEGAPVLGADNEPLSGHVRLIGGTAKGSWGGVTIRSKTDNSFDYVDILNGGSGTAAYSCVVHVYPGSLSMTNSLIDGSASNGITTEGGGVLTAFSQNTVSNCGKAPVYAYSNLWSLRNIAGDNVFTGNTNGYIHVNSAGATNADMTIRKLSIPWQLYNRFNVNESAKLTVEPGTIIRFDSGAGITVASTAAVVMDGTEDQHIVLSGITTNAGAWGNVDIRSKRNENSLSYVDILNGGGGTAAWSSALYLYGGAADVNNCTIVNSGSNGLTTESDGYLRTFAGNAVNKSGK
ncbi:MAG: hypothetical protein LBK05_11175, partial [Treponema sp.]|nr:hypothetical protein [Treponema sp.]